MEFLVDPLSLGTGVLFANPQIKICPFGYCAQDYCALAYVDEPIPAPPDSTGGGK